MTIGSVKDERFNREYAIELSKLILDNPKMRVIVWINSENISDDYGSLAGNFHRPPCIETIAYSEVREVWISKENDNFEDCYNYYGWDAENWSDFEGMTITPFDDDEWFAKITLTRDDGDTLEYDIESELEQMIIGMQIIDFTERRM